MANGMRGSGSEPARGGRGRAGGTPEWVGYLSVGQGLYYLITGLWPIFNVRTFQMVTGPKVDLWLVKTVGVLVAVIGLVLTLAGVRRQMLLEIFLLAWASALGLTIIDVAYVLARRIPPVYLLDALVEVILVGLWTFALTIYLRRRRMGLG